MTRDTQHSLELLRPAPDVDYCSWHSCARRAHVVIDGRAYCVTHAIPEFTYSLQSYMGPGVVPSDARF